MINTFFNVIYAFFLRYSAVLILTINEYLKEKKKYQITTEEENGTMSNLNRSNDIVNLTYSAFSTYY